MQKPLGPGQRQKAQDTEAKSAARTAQTALETLYTQEARWEECVDVLERHTYDFLNNNCFLKIVTINQLGYRIVLKAIKIALKLPPTLQDPLR